MNKRHYAWSLRWIIVGAFFIIMAITLGALSFYLTQSTANDYMSANEVSLATTAELAGRLIANDNGLVDSKSIKTTLTWVQIKSDSRAPILYDLNGVRIYPLAIIQPDGKPPYIGDIPPDAKLKEKEAAVHPPLPEEAQMALNRDSGLGEVVRFDPVTGEQTLYIATLVKSKSKPVATLAILVLAKPLTDIQNAIEQIRLTIGMAFFAVLVVLFMVFIGVSNYITQPLARLSVTTERYAAGLLNERVKPRGASEIYSIGISFNRMADQLRQTITRLAAERAQAEAMLTSMTDGVIVTDIPGKIRLVNHSTELMCDISERDVRGKTLAEAGFPEMLDDLRMKSQTTRLPLQFEFTLDHTPVRIIEVHMAPIEVDGDMLGVVVVFYDVTQQRKLEQVHRDFVANVSHELRTPVTSIRAMAETMITIGNEDEELRNEFLQTTIAESERLSGLLDGLLNLSRIESGSMHLSPEELDISDIVQHVAQRLIAPIAQKGQQLQMDLPPAFPAYIDHDALVQITLNLIDNARKYSPEGATISITLRQLGDACHLQVTDTGVGISDEDRERIFERFYRVDKARSRGLGGTGLGLAIVKQLVELLHGSISVTSKPGQGSTFTVIIPDVVRQEP